MMLPTGTNKIVGNLDDCQAQWQCEKKSVMMLQKQIRRVGDDYDNARYHGLD